jgi:hypothetical protein
MRTYLAAIRETLGSPEYWAGLTILLFTVIVVPLAFAGAILAVAAVVDTL